MKLILGQEIDLQADKRYIQHIRGHAIGDVYDALVELITNADDSYNRLFMNHKRSRDGGDILIEHLELRKDQRSKVVVRDKAEGMTLREMYASLQRLGAYSSEEGNRGYMGRGARDCTELGDLTFESIKDDHYYRCAITRNLKFRPEIDGQTATEERRHQLGIPHGNGTSVVLELLESISIPRLETLSRDLPWHYALRDIMGGTADSSVLLRRLDDHRGKPLPLVYRQPEGDLVVDETFEVEGYAPAKAKLQIWRALEPIEDYKARFERYGILVKGKRAIHECSLLVDEFKRDPLARRYFGRLECPYLDQLLADYEACRREERQNPPENPRLVVDPNRRTGLERGHPFVKKLLLPPIERIRSLLARDREKEKPQQRDVANEDTRERLGRLAKLAGRFLQEQLETLDDLSTGESVDNDAFAKQGVLIYPTYLNVAIGKERALTVYVKRAMLTDLTESVVVQADPSDAVEIVGSPFTLHPHRSKDDRLVGMFAIRGCRVKDAVILTAKCNGLPTAQALAQVVPETTEQRDFGAPLEFECKEYSVRIGSRKALRLFAKYPDVVASESEVQVTSADSEKVVVRGKCALIPVTGSNYAEGEVVVEGRTLKAKAIISAEVNGRQTTAYVRVIDKPEDDRSIPIVFKIMDEEYGNFRARWADREGKPNLLLISAKHRSLSRYLGAPPNFPGQDTPLFRVLIAEIVAESVCHRALSLEAKQRPWDFRWADLKEDYLIADDVRARLQQRLRSFLAGAHSVMLGDKEVSALAD
jgi:hypothetical protein